MPRVCKFEVGQTSSGMRLVSYADGQRPHGTVWAHVVNDSDAVPDSLCVTSTECGGNAVDPGCLPGVDGDVDPMVAGQPASLGMVLRGKSLLRSGEVEPDNTLPGEAGCSPGIFD